MTSKAAAVNVAPRPDGECPLQKSLSLPVAMAQITPVTFNTRWPRCESPCDMHDGEVKGAGR
jgi:hypothetical protein